MNLAIMKESVVNIAVWDGGMNRLLMVLRCSSLPGKKTWMVTRGWRIHSSA